MNFSVATSVMDRKPLVLAVDDNPDNLLLLEYQLNASVDCLLMTAICGKAALSLIQQNLPDLVLLDIVLPDIDGIEIARHLRSRSDTAGIRIVALTASAGEEDRDRILRSGCDDYLAKPYDLDELEAILHRHLKCRSHP